MKHFQSGNYFLSCSQHLAFFPKRVWALRKSVHFSKRIIFSGLQTAETHVQTSNITSISGLCTCHKPSCCNTQSSQLPCNKSCYCEAHCVLYLLTVWQRKCFISTHYEVVVELNCITCPPVWGVMRIVKVTLIRWYCEYRCTYGLFHKICST